MKDKFGLEARFYDKIWGKHDYDSDIKFLHNLFRKCNCRKIIDVGCGTGGHSLRLVKLGYEVTGVDISPTMLSIAKQKDKDEKVRFVIGDVRKLERFLGKSQKFDAAICLGQTFSCLITNRDVSMFFEGLREVLRKDGLLIFDARNAKKIKEEYLDKLILDHIITEKKIQVVLLAYNSRWTRNRNVIVWRPIYLIKEEDKVDIQIREHKLRWFYFSELEKVLAEKGFEILATYSGNAGKRFKEDKDESMWFVAIAR